MSQGVRVPRGIHSEFTEKDFLPNNSYISINKRKEDQVLGNMPTTNVMT